MRLEPEVPGFKAGRIAVETESIFGSVKLLVDGVDLIREGTKEQRRRPTAKTDRGKRVTIRLGSLFDPFSKLRVDGKVVRMSPRFKWYQWLVVAWPLFLNPILSVLAVEAFGTRSPDIPISTSLTAGFLSLFYGTRALRSGGSAIKRIGFAFLVSLVSVTAAVLLSAVMSRLF